MNKVVCTCGHLGVNCGEVGIIVNSGESALVKWNNGIVEAMQYDDIEFLTNRNKKVYIVSYNCFEKVFLNKKRAENFKKIQESLDYKVSLEIKCL
ncbi:hypothetical protein FDF26_15390 [Clostridium botulinum]|nr:hypothetical protein [Clostridium botulinum]